jgi:hypothetical protein
MRRPVFFVLLGVGILLLGAGLSAQDRIEKAKIYQESYALSTESDLYCNIFVLDGGLPDIRIVGAERQEEKILLNDSDKFYVDKGRADGLEVGQVFLALQVGRRIGEYGVLAKKTGRVRVVGLEEKRGIVLVDKTCGEVLLGGYLVPYVERESLIGKDDGYAAELDESQGLKGQIIHIETEFHIVGTGGWALIDMGQDKGLSEGQQLTVFKSVKTGMPREAIGNVVVIDVQKATSTIKVLSCRDSIEVGFQVQTK